MKRGQPYLIRQLLEKSSREPLFFSLQFTKHLDDGSYYIHMNMVGQYVDLCVDAHQQIFVIWHRKQVLRQVPIKGLQRTLLPFEQFVALMCQQALSEQRRLLQAQQETATTVL